MSQTENYTIDGLVAESIVNIQDLSLNYYDTLYAYCPKLQKQFQWIGVCMICFVDHSNQKKSVKLNGTLIEIAGSEHYVIIDIVNFTKELKRSLSKELNDIYTYCETQQEILSQAFEIAIESIGKKKDTVLSEQYKLHSLAQFCEKKQLHNNRDQKIFFVECQKERIEWNGYCPLCGIYQNHLVSIYFRQSGFFTKPQTINTEQTSCYRLIDSLQLKLRIQNYLYFKVYDQIFSIKSMELLQKQVIPLEEINNKVDLKQSSIHSLQQKLDQDAQIISQRVKQEHDLKTDNQILMKEIEDLKVDENTFESSKMYDISINCNNLNDLSNDIGWKVDKTDVYDQQKKENCSVVSFYGLFNKGKSFLASKLSGKPISTGYSIQTIGLSALYPRKLSKENAIIFLDTAGLETPINHHKHDAIYERFQQQYEENDILFSKIYEAKLIDRLLTENLIEKFVLNESHLILIIVNQLSKEEQKLIKKVKSKYQKNQIIIVHNYNKLEYLDQVQKYIEIDILNSVEYIDSQFRNLGNDLSGVVYIQQRFTDDEQMLEPIVHVVMAKENSEAGNKYNAFCYKYLQSRMNSIYQLKKFDLIQSLMAQVEKELDNLFKFNFEQKKEQYKLQYDENLKSITANLQNIQLKSISFNMLGDMQLQDELDAPKYSIQLMNEYLIIEVELTGRFLIQKDDQEEKWKKYICLCEISNCSLLEWHGFRNNQEQIIQIRAQYQGPYSPLLEMPDNSEMQRLNKFSLSIPIPAMMCILKPARPNFRFQSGIGRLQFSIQKIYQ